MVHVSKHNPLNLFSALLLVCGLPALSLPVMADAPQPETQPSTQPTTRPADSQPATTTAATTTAAAEEEPDRFVAVINGQIRTMTGLDLDGATVLAKNGRITAIGEDVRLPDECEVIDARGMYVYPGIVAAGSGGLFTRNYETTDVFSLSMKLALAGGITAATSGDTTVIKLAYGSTDDTHVATTAEFVDLGYSTSKPLDRAELEADLKRVREYLRDYAAWKREKQHDEDAEEPDKEWLTGKYENYRKLLEKDAVAVFRAGEAPDLRVIAGLADRFGLEYIVRGAREGWIAASDMARSCVGAVISTRDERAPDERSNKPSGSSIENARILHEHGIPIAIIPTTTSVTLWGLAGRDLLHTNMEAAFAVRGGLPERIAEKAITLFPARILGVDARIGSLEVGKDADLVICDGPLLDYMTQVHYTLVDGRIVYEKREERLFRHIRPEGRPGKTEFEDLWPRRLAWPEHLLKPEPQPASQPATEAEPAAAE